MDFSSFFNAVKPAYEIEQSLRFDDNGSTYLYRTPSSAGNQQTWTFSAWLKRGSFTANQGIFTPYYGGDGSNESQIRWKSDNTLQIYDSGGARLNFVTTQVFRDPSAWYHLVVAVDTTQATEANRFKLYINGEQITAFGTASYPTQNQTLGWNGTSRHDIGRYAQGGNLYYGGYMAEIHQIDGTQLDPTSFGEEDESGVWRPKRYTGSYGTNGFYIKGDETATNGIGHDHSGNGNNFTASGFTTSGSGTDVMSDTPTKNWATLNAVDKASNHTVSDGNLKITQGSTTDNNTASTIAVSSGKWYFEVEVTNHAGSTSYDIGVGKDLSRNTVLGNNATSYAYSSSGNKRTNSTNSSYGDSFTTGDIVGAAFDADNGTLTFYKNGVSQGQAFTGLTDGPYHFLAGTYVSGDVRVVNFGQREFANRPGDTVGATSYFNTVTYTANNQSTNAVTGVGFQPDLVWLKTRSRDEHHYIYDAVRGAGDRISPSQTIAEVTGDNTFTSFDSDGFTLGSDGAGIANYQTDSMVAWCFKAGGTASANTDGTINSSVSANNNAGFSIVTYTGTGNAGTVGHGLSTAPSMILVKNRDSAEGWRVYHSALSSASKYLVLNSSAGADTANSVFNGTAPTTSVFSIGDGTAVNNSGDDLVAYCWTEKTGVSKFGEYTGNGSSDGPVISCGFRPAMVIIKWYESVNSAESWQLYDNKRAGNPTNTILQPDSNADDESPSDRHIQFTADGFQLKAGGQQINRSGAKYVFMAFAGTFTAGDTHKSLNSANLPAPTIKDGSDYFNTVLYTGNAVNNRTVTGLDFTPDFLWLKKRNSSDRHVFSDVVRGATNTLYGDDTHSESSATESNQVQGFTSGGFTIGSNNQVNGSGDTFVVWAWDAGGNGSSNTDGSVTSTVSANATAGFSIITYQANGTAGMNFGHGLGVAPGFVICKNRDDVNPWIVWHKDLPETNYLLLNTNGKQQTQSDWITTSSSTITWDSLSGSTTTNGSDYLVLAFAEVDGYSKFGKYTGNGSSSDGPFIYTGFRPAFILFKNYAHGSEYSWSIVDNTRDTYNVVQKTIYPDIPNGEDGTVSAVDFCANGFKLRNAWQNENGSDHIYVAFAENPFGGDGVSPATAR